MMHKGWRRRPHLMPMAYGRGSARVRYNQADRGLAKETLSRIS